MCPVATADAVEKLGVVDAEITAVNKFKHLDIASESKAWDVSILGFPGYVLTSE
jgi:hypothetical protein